MRYAFITDIHGQYDNLQWTLAHIETKNIDEIICLGDIFEIKVKKSVQQSYIYQRIDEVVDIDPQLVNALLPYRCIVGNQEERLLKIVPMQDIPTALFPFLLAPTHLYLNCAYLTHGHLFDWINPLGDIWHPLLQKFERPFIIYGHNHANALFKVDDNHRSCSAYKPIEVIYNQPIMLDEHLHYLINVGAIRSKNPSWLLYD